LALFWDTLILHVHVVPPLFVWSIRLDALVFSALNTPPSTVYTRSGFS
jgi:hypothetical protein